MMIKVFPRGMFGASVVDGTVKITNIKAPIKPKTAPMALREVIFSLIKTAERIKTKIGEMVMMTEEFIGVDKLKPLKENNILITIPKIAQAIILGQSRRCMGSYFVNILTNQNKIPAPVTLSRIKPKG